MSEPTGQIIVQLQGQVVQSAPLHPGTLTVAARPITTWPYPTRWWPAAMSN
jgi:hypothetical protein